MMRHNGFRMAPAKQSGVGLIEVLIAVLVLSIGFLGMAAMQARSLSMNNSSMARSFAVMESYSILDAMRADLVAAQSGAYNVASVNASGSGCPTATGTLADAQLTQWCTQLVAGLGASASGSINCTGSLGLCTVTVTYDDSKSVSATTDTTGQQTVTTQAML
ncbi:type IV pilus modification protein PilV [Dyella caseinilytica]|uniref:Type IV pilus modification protein PilV n=1 Tax=Dyella caseinilytica TaxID=1849581 RepID=A0ABX7GVW8_9GAMM|nr:type IV pilus modification protein PilV [Dyella caseinilytica]QRN54604.1 type IV pilus modification protein PilV [Dyella caseinilytica]GFZ95502.1 type IV pilus modification protein PilV [Dyella caseinilytica]